MSPGSPSEIRSISSPGDAESPPEPAAFHDGKAFAAVVEAWSRLVFSTALRRLEGDAESAREVTQNVFLTAFRKADAPAKVKFPAAGNIWKLGPRSSRQLP